MTRVENISGKGGDGETSITRFARKCQNPSLHRRRQMQRHGPVEAVPSSETSCSALGRLRYHEVILDTEGAEYLVRSNARDLLVHRAADHAVEA